MNVTWTAWEQQHSGQRISPDSWWTRCYERSWTHRAETVTEKGNRVSHRINVGEWDLKDPDSPAQLVKCMLYFLNKKIQEIEG